MVKRGGGQGTGVYSGGLPAAGDEPRLARPEQSPPASAAHDRSGSLTGPSTPERQDAQRAPAPAYAATRWSEVLGNRVMLDLLAQTVRGGEEPEMSIYFDSAREAFGPDSVHFVAACRGEAGAGPHYQRTVAGGRFRDGG